MEGLHFLVAFALLAIAAAPLASANDPSSLQDFCVAVDNPKHGILVNGKLCKKPEYVTTDDFIFSGLNVPANTDNDLGLNITFATVDEYPGVNTLGISRVRIDFARDGLNPPHFHPRASETQVVLKGKLYAGFITSKPDYRLFAKVLHPGDSIVFPVGLIHFQLNIGETEALAFATFNSQNPGVIRIADALFGSNPPVHPRVLTKGLKLDKKVVKGLQEHFGVDSNDEFADIVGYSNLCVEKVRYKAVSCMSRSYRPTVPVPYIAQVLGFSCSSEANNEKDSDGSGLEECVEWLKAHGACLVADNNGEMQFDAKASSSSLFMPEPEDAVAHGDATLAVNDFFTRTSS